MGSKHHIMKLLLQTCLSFFICLASAAPAGPKWEPLSKDLKKCNNKFIATVSVKDVPKFDKKSGTDLYFKVYQNGEKIHKSESHRDIENKDEYIKFKPFEISADPKEFLEIEMTLFLKRVSLFKDVKKTMKCQMNRLQMDSFV